MSGCATKSDIRYLETRITRGFNFIDSQITDNEEGIKFLAKEMEKNHPYPRKPTDKCYSLCRNKFEESGENARKQTNAEFLNAIKVLTEGK
jgi:hypothetical protein